MRGSRYNIEWGVACWSMLYIRRVGILAEERGGNTTGGGGVGNMTEGVGGG